MTTNKKGLGLKTSVPAIAWFAVFVAILFFSRTNTVGQSLPHTPRPDFDETGRKLPPGVPKLVETNGVLHSIDRHFTTQAYQDEALKMVIQEANEVAKALDLPEHLPITKSDLRDYHISPFGFAYPFKMIGGVTTKNFSYYVNCDNKFADLCVGDYDETCFKLIKQALPLNQINTNAAYQLATQWLTAASIDVRGLNRDCAVKVILSDFWNKNSFGAEPHKNKFVPIYDVSWLSPEDLSKGGDTAHVELFAPSRKLLQMTIYDPKYILRKPVEFTNMETLFPGVATIHTNYPTKSITVDWINWGTN